MRLVQRWAPESLFWRVFGANALVFIIGGVLLALSPATVSSPIKVEQAVTLGVGIATMLVVDLALMRQLFAPLARLSAAMRSVDPLRPGQRVPHVAHGSELAELVQSFNEMLDRLEEERRASAHREALATDAEQRRIAGELHDEVGQRLTLLLLNLAAVQTDAAPSTATRLQGVRDLAHQIVDDLRAVVVRLRPLGLDELGIERALSALADSIEGAHVRISRRLDRVRGDLPPVARLVIYRVAQEALTNAIRHAPGSPLHLELSQAHNGRLRLRIGDDGPGIPANATASRGMGLRWMAERALVIGGTLTVDSSAEGTTVTLTVPEPIEE